MAVVLIVYIAYHDITLVVYVCLYDVIWDVLQILLVRYLFVLVYNTIQFIPNMYI